MNPLTNVKNTLKLNDRMLDMGVEDSVSWHKQYKDSAYIFIGGLPYGLTEGDILCVFSQYGEIVNINLVRDSKTGETKGFCFLCYEDQRSTILAVDNFNGIKLGGRTIRVDHCSNYRRPKSDEKDEDGNRKEIIEEGCAPKTPSPSPTSSDNEEPTKPTKKRKKEKKAKKKKDKNRRPKAKDEPASSDGSDADHEQVKRKKLDLQDKRAELADSRSQRDDWKSHREEKHGDSAGKGRKDERERDGERERERERERDRYRDRDERYPREDQRRRDLRNDRRDTDTPRDRSELSRHADRTGFRNSRDHNDRRNERRERDRPRHDGQDRDHRRSDNERKRS